MGWERREILYMKDQARLGVEIVCQREIIESGRLLATIPADREG